MEKTLTIDGKEVRFKTSAALPRLYRQMFKRDVFLDLNRARSGISNKKKISADDLPIEALEVIENLAFCMAKYADPSVPDDINDWLDQFSTTAVYQVAQDVLLMWNEEQRTASVPKKPVRQSTGK